ncbi:MAG: hypothetical protein V2B18_02090 [Pseudomonadota bacterium]
MTIRISHDKELYEIGGGILYLAEWSGNAPPAADAYFDVGNCSDWAYEVAVTRVDHYSLRGGRKVIDRSIVTTTGYSFWFVLDELSLVNVALFVQGAAEGNVIHALQRFGSEYAVKFVTDNYSGENKIFEFRRCVIRPRRSANMIEPTRRKRIPFHGEGLEDWEHHPESPFFEITVVDEE